MKTILPLIGGDNNEAPELKFSRLSVLKDAQGLSPRSSASLYRRTQSSTPCAMLANSLDSTFISKYSIIAGGSVILSDCFLRLGATHSRLAQLSINKPNHDNSIAPIISAGLTRNERNTPISASYGRKIGNGADDKLPGKSMLRREQHGHSVRARLPSAVRPGRTNCTDELGCTKDGFHHIPFVGGQEVTV